MSLFLNNSKQVSRIQSLPKIQVEASTRLTADEATRHLRYLCQRIGIERADEVKIKQISDLIKIQGQGYIEYEQLQKILQKVFKQLELNHQ